MDEENNEKHNGILLTGLWENKKENGETFYNGPLSYGSSLLLVKNSNKKEGGKSPDLLLFIVPKREESKKGAGLDGEIPF